MCRSFTNILFNYYNWITRFKVKNLARLASDRAWIQTQATESRVSTVNSHAELSSVGEPGGSFPSLDQYFSMLTFKCWMYFLFQISMECYKLCQDLVA